MNRQIITHELVTETGNFRSCVEASTLGLRAGEWPAYLDVAPGFGNGQQLVRKHHQIRDGELVAVDYTQIAGCLTVTIFND